MDNALQNLILSASLGALIGLIRQWGEQQGPESNGNHFAGLRTFVLWSLLGYASALISDRHSPSAFIAALSLVALHWIARSLNAKSTPAIGLTSAAAGLITLFLGALVYWDHLLIAVMLAALTMIVLGIKQTTHSWTRRFTREDIRTTLQFVAVTGVILPIVPDQGYGPYDAINPYSIWFMVVLISGLGFVGYLLIRLLGARAGVALTGLVGGLASSTATTLAFSRESKSYPELSRGFALAIVMASTIMFGRVIVILGFVYPQFIQTVWLPFTVMAVPGLIYAVAIGLLNKHGKEATDTPDLKNPLGLRIAIKFALIYGLITFLVKVFSETDLTDGLLILSFVSGLTNMDAIALSITNSLKDGEVALQLAGRAVVLAAIGNTVLKAGLVFSIGTPALRKHVGIALGATVLAGGAAVFLV